MGITNMKNRNKAALDYFEVIWRQAEGVDLALNEVIRAALPHEDAPVGEVGDILKALDTLQDVAHTLRKQAELLETRHSDGFIEANSIIREMNIHSVRLHKVYAELVSLRTHSQQKDVWKLVDALHKLTIAANTLHKEIDATFSEADMELYYTGFAEKEAALFCATFDAEKALAAFKGETK
jgi:hypothetical protein